MYLSKIENIVYFPLKIKTKEAMSDNSTKVYYYLKDKFNTPTSKSNVAQIVTMYLKKENQQQIDTLMLLLYNESFSEILTNSSSYKPKPKPKPKVEVEKTVKELEEKIMMLEIKIQHLTEDNDELRTNYWNLKESVNKTKHSKTSLFQ